MLLLLGAALLFNPSLGMRGDPETLDDPVESKLRALACKNSWKFGGTTQKTVDPDDGETQYTFTIIAKDKFRPDQVIQRLEEECQRNRWTLVGKIPRKKKGKTTFTIVLVVEKSQEQMVQKIMDDGFQYTDTQVEVSGDRRLSGGDWLDCEKGIPEFVFRWTENGTSEQKRAIEAWFNWNKEYRTLMKRMEAGMNASGQPQYEYWIISMWKKEYSWTIELWNQENFNISVRKPKEITYMREGTHAPREGDLWYAIGDLSYNGFTYPGSHKRPEISVLGFPTEHAQVCGSFRKGLKSQQVMERTDTTYQSPKRHRNASSW